MKKDFDKLEHENIKSWVILSQIKTISTKRLLRKIGSISDSDFGKVVLKMQTLLKIENPLAEVFSEAEAIINNYGNKPK